MELSIDGYKPLSMDEGGERTHAEPLPLGERVHQESVAKELFTSAEHSNPGASADLARWASEELVPRQPNGAPGGAQPVPLVSAAPAAGSEPLDGGPASGQPASQPAPVELPRSEMMGELLARQTAGRGRQRVVLMVALTLIVALVLVLLWGLGPREQPSNPVQTEVASPRGATPDPAKTEPGKTEPAKAEPAKAEAPKGAAATAVAPAGKAEPAKEPGGDQAKAADPKAADQGLRAEDFERTVAESTPAYKKCIEEALRKNPKLKVGKIQIATKIAPSGKVLEAGIDKKDVEESLLGQCLLGTTKRIVFPPFAGEPTEGVIPLHVTGGE
jgi:hypothetical protein